MKVLLINPSYDIKRYMGKLSKIAFVFQPIGLTYIAAYLRSKRVEVKIYDSQIETEPIQKVVKEFDPEIIGITCVTFLVYSTIELSKLLKREFPNKTIIVGGIHPTIRPQDFLREETIDCVAIGEGELIMYEFVKAVESGSCPTKISGRPIKNLDDLPPPDIDDVVKDGYQPSTDNKTGDKVAVILTSRGCPFNCIFCANQLLTKGKYRAHSIERVCSEIDNLITKRNITQLFVQDDNFAVNKKRAKKLCREFIKRGFHKKVTWWAEARVDCVDKELLFLMTLAGCRIISYGLESGNQRLLDYTNKGITLEQIRETIKLTKKVGGIDIRASFILGLPTETREESLRTIKFARELGIDQVRFALATPFPGTKLWDIAQAEGSLDITDWRRFSLMAGYSKGLPCYAPKGRDPKELARLQRRANLRFFLNPRTVKVYLRRMTNFRSFLDISFGAIKFIRASLFPDR